MQPVIVAEASLKPKAWAAYTMRLPQRGYHLSAVMMSLRQSSIAPVLALMELGHTMQMKTEQYPSVLAKLRSWHTLNVFGIVPRRGMFITVTSTGANSLEPSQLEN